MSEYRANTDIMRNAVAIISKVTSGVSGIAGRVRGLENQIGGEYQGQLREKVHPILAGLDSAGSQLQGQSDGLGSNLSSIANEIDGVMQANVASLSEAFAPSSATPVSSFFNSIGQMALGGWATILTILGFSRLQTTNIPPQPTPVPTPIPASVPTLVPTSPNSLEGQSNYVGFAAEVPAFDMRKNELYYRTDPVTKTNSDCTWYAAEAVEKAHGIPLNDSTKFSNSLGNAGQWADHVKEAMKATDPKDPYYQYKAYIAGVDNYPKPGDVYAMPVQDGFPTGHVMFVEQATKTVDAKGRQIWQLVVSEENWGGKDLIRGTTVQAQIPGVERWTRTFTMPVDANGGVSGSGEFIHFVDSKGK